MLKDKKAKVDQENAGALAEQLACQFLLAQGLQLVERNWRCRYGEIDLIMREGAIVVFVEVRLRTNQGFGGASTSITLAKQQKLRVAAEHYLARQETLPACRFDAVLLTGLSTEHIEWLRHIMDGF